jgi:hypothetical protein
MFVDCHVTDEHKWYCGTCVMPAYVHRFGHVTDEHKRAMSHQVHTHYMFVGDMLH